MLVNLILSHYLQCLHYTMSHTHLYSHINIRCFIMFNLNKVFVFVFKYFPNVFVFVFKYIEKKVFVFVFVFKYFKKYLYLYLNTLRSI